MPLIDTHARGRFVEQVWIDGNFAGTIRRRWFFFGWKAYDPEGLPIDGESFRNAEYAILRLGLAELGARW